jgi:hemerythrin superfamily protein
MARKRKSAARRTRAKTTARAKSSRASTSRQDAISLLKADHRQVEQWFEQFESSRSESKKSELAERICQALTVHASIEEEIFYPAFYEATQEKSLHHEAEIEHEGARNLIEQIKSSGPSDDYFDAKVKVLSEMIKHHVREEEKRAGMFAKAREADMDLDALGEQLAARKAQLMGGADAEEEMSTRRSARSSAQDHGAMTRLARRMRGE